MVKVIILLMIAMMALISACDVTDTGTADMESPSLLAGKEALFSNGVGPDNLGQGAFYPLDIGNSWIYTGERSMSIGDYESYHLSVQEMRSLTGTEELFGREYTLEKQVIILSGGIGPDDTITYWCRYRQDRAGLYEADIAANDPPGKDGDAVGPSGENLNRVHHWDVLWQKSIERLESIDEETVERARTAHFNKINAVYELLGRKDGRALLTSPPGGILPDEIQRLRYPMHPRQEWIIRNAPLFYAVVDRQEVLDLPAGMINGWRIRYYNEFLDENDLVYFWYGRRGFLGMTAHLETEMDGVYGTVISDEDLFLESYDLEDKGNKENEKEIGKIAESTRKMMLVH